MASHPPEHRDPPQPLCGTGSIIQECPGLAEAEPPARSVPDRNRGSAGKEQTGGK